MGSVVAAKNIEPGSSAASSEITKAFVSVHALVSGSRGVFGATPGSPNVAFIPLLLREYTSGSKSTTPCWSPSAELVIEPSEEDIAQPVTFVLIYAVEVPVAFAKVPLDISAPSETVSLFPSSVPSSVPGDGGSHATIITIAKIRSAASSNVSSFFDFFI